ncbi:hypothetical protein G6F57_003202 [Rhizopus arrhizus]|uniref:Uncharacterized protein n=1 Tax=Rhizopus oryzae TaxID=64495 RepID=A0A9P7BRZ1_RHIOR|nr:hypothetical protein G6F23_009464 [Rhizopus arrhizus]KAG0761285.1 hypothetical protein G6F24_007680 [Rhizopus arrhizus]KAG0789539.1 hypothetical protein G6F21_006447 [Rhizopus arrhizus]KAG0809766.1 hypothetical protein G6F20_008513 [Rhizopus arrhizus]KAG0829094.1 hypothetical protein G6F18_008767 [Rhizopus arrhizus]
MYLSAINNYLTPSEEEDKTSQLINQVKDTALRLSLQEEYQSIQKDHQRIVSLLSQRSDTLYQENEELKLIVHESQKRYEKAVREMQFYKKKCEDDSEVFYERQRNNSGTSLFSVNSSQSTEGSVYSAKMSSQRSSVYQTGNSIIQQRKLDPLGFGGSDALWDTIAKSQGSSDVTVEKIISNFLRRGGSPNTAKQSATSHAVKYGYGMIHALIVIKAPRPLDLLLQQGANPNVISLGQMEEDKVSPCYLAAKVGWLAGLQRLVQAGGDLMSARGEGIKKKTVLHVAAEEGHLSLVEYIIHHTQDVLNHETDSEGANALHYASASGHTDLVAYIIRTCQLSVDTLDNRSETPLHWAARAGQLEVVKLLVEKYKSEVNAYLTKKVGTPYDLAKSAGNKKVVDYLKQMGGMTSKKMDKKKEEEVPKHLESALTRNGFFMD